MQGRPLATILQQQQVSWELAMSTATFTRIFTSSCSMAVLREAEAWTDRGYGIGGAFDYDMCRTPAQ